MKTKNFFEEQEIQNYIAKVEEAGRVRPKTGGSWVRDAKSIKFDKNITRATRDVYNALLDICTETNNIVIATAEELAKEAGCCRKTVWTAQESLKKHGYIDQLTKEYKTQTNIFYVFKILPDKKRPSKQEQTEKNANNRDNSALNENKMPSADLYQVLAQEQAQASKPIKLRKAAPPKARYGQFGYVTLTADEYDDLVQSFGKKTVETYIQRADNYSMERNKYYPNNAETIRKWITEDKKRAEHQHQQRKFGHLFNRGTSENSGKFEKMPKKELEGYLKLGIRFRDPDTMPEEPPKPKYVPVHYDYELTDEEIMNIFCSRGDCSFIQNDLTHPLHSCTIDELYEWANILQDKREAAKKAEKLKNSDDTS